MAMEMKKMVVDASDIMQGDLVVSKNGLCCYFVLSADETLLHSHHFIRVIYADTGKRQKWYIHQLTGKRTIYRMVNGEEKEKE